MTSRYDIYILAIKFSLISILISCGEIQNEGTGQLVQIKGSDKIQFYTSKTAVLPFNPERNYPFDSSFKPSVLTQNDINIIDSLLIACVTDYNNSLGKSNKEWGIDLKKYDYRKQLISVTNLKGEKEVWVNCFCDTWNSEKWKTEIMHVDDGGNFYFNFKVNLATRNFYQLAVNGVA